MRLSLASPRWMDESRVLSVFFFLSSKRKSTFLCIYIKLRPVVGSGTPLKEENSERKCFRQIQCRNIVRLFFFIVISELGKSAFFVEFCITVKRTLLSVRRFLAGCSLFTKNGIWSAGLFFCICFFFYFLKNLNNVCSFIFFRLEWWKYWKLRKNPLNFK